MLRRTAPAVLSTLLCALALFGTTTLTWIHAAVTTSLQPVTVDVTGADAAPAVTALGLVAAVAAVASALGGRVLRTVVGAVVALAGVGGVVAVLAVTADPRAAAQPAVGRQTGVLNAGGDYTMTGWPWAAVAAAVLLAVCGVWLVLVAQRVRGRASRRYDRGAPAVNESVTSPTGPDPADAPGRKGAPSAGPGSTAAGTAASATGGAPDAAAPSTAGETQAAEHADDIDTWDALTRGEDPTGDA
ncbi:Trp biosynthesis-associated membrane protein [Kocuria sp. BT304]|uniref:Trp biosynthesis-associated membrane protein n=1 Tax=Kocuria sp. BT304 TaxID=1702043 RepID=UPI000DD45BF1|nr:Trp biosynthesis-associated membrane protein [Kocuria sp. BT304]